MLRRFFPAFLFSLAPVLAQNPPAANPAIVPAVNREKDCYVWQERHEAALAAREKIDPEIVLIGDSITHFWGGEPASPGVAPRGPEAWKKAFGERRVLNLGFGWDRTQNVLWRIDHGELDGLRPKWIVLNIGTNNSSGTASARANTPVEAAAGVQAVLDRIHAKTPDARIILMGLFPRGREATDPKRAYVRELNALLAAEARSRGAVFLDLDAQFLAPDGTLPASLMPDAVHPNEAGYALWAAALAKELR